MRQLPSSSRCARRIDRKRGAASVEAAIALPVLVILFISLFYVRDHLVAQQSAGIHARSCAWAYSMDNCNQVPSGCEDALRLGKEGDRVGDEVSEQLGGIAPGLIKDAIMVVLGPVLDAMLGRSLDATTATTFARPTLYGGGTATALGHYHLGCNLTEQRPIDVAKSIWTSVF
jgi:hypothetical protein